MSRLLDLDLETDSVEDADGEGTTKTSTATNLSEEEEDEFFNLLKSPSVGKSVTNLSEYLLMTEAMTGRIKVSAPSQVNPNPTAN